MADVRAMLAIGRRGQLGLDGRLPWEGAQGDEYRNAVERFFSLTKGHVLLAGPTTIASVPASAKLDRTIVAIRSSDKPEEILAATANAPSSSAAVWTAYAHLINEWDITRLPYDGEADRWFDPTWLLGRFEARQEETAYVFDRRPQRG